MKRPNLRKVGPTWFYDHGGKPRRWEKLGSDEKVALHRYAELRAAARSTTGTVDAMLRDCLDAMASTIAAGTLRQYRMFRGHLGAVFGHLAPDELTQADVLQYLDECPRTSFRGEVSLLSMAYQGWMRRRLLTFNPCLGVRTDRPRAKRTRHLADAELDAIIAKADERLAVAIELAYATALRIGDLCALRWPDLADGVRTGKTGVRQAFAPSPALDAILARARALQARVASPFVLCDRGGKPWTPERLRGRWNTACRRAGVADAHFHDVRAKRATDTERELGRDAAQQALGHRDARTTDVYLRERRANVVRPLTRRRG